jgi:hypothetical protein
VIAKPGVLADAPRCELLADAGFAPDERGTASRVAFRGLRRNLVDYRTLTNDIGETVPCLRFGILDFACQAGFIFHRFALFLGILPR